MRKTSLYSKKPAGLESGNACMKLHVWSRGQLIGSPTRCLHHYVIVLEGNAPSDLEAATAAGGGLSRRRRPAAGLSRCSRAACADLSGRRLVPTPTATAANSHAVTAHQRFVAHEAGEKYG
jgi:hypothetical protein